MKWNDDWRQELEMENEGCFYRLCDCRSTFNDVVIMTRYMYEYNKEQATKEECFDRMLEWCGGWNNQDEILNITMEQYDKMLNSI